MANPKPSGVTFGPIAWRADIPASPLALRDRATITHLLLVDPLNEIAIEIVDREHESEDEGDARQELSACLAQLVARLNDADDLFPL